MNIVLTIFFILLILFSIVEKNHKILFSLVILAVFTDVFTLELGSVVHLSNIVGFVMLPLIIRFYTKGRFAYITRKVTSIFKPLWLNFFYLIVLGYIFGFLIPWENTGGYRTWSQQASGRTIVTLVRLFNEFCIALYIIWAILTEKVNIKFIVMVIGCVTFASFLVGIIEYGSGFPIIRSLIQETPKILSERFLGLCGEPKSFGRNAALAYIITLAYYLKVEKKKIFLFFIIINVITVILSLSASTFILFIMFNVYMLISSKKLHLLFLYVPLFFVGYFVVSSNPMFEVTKNKMDKAIFGSDNISNYSDNTSGAMSIVSRFDIFDHLAYVFLINNPQYIVTGTGPNLISLPASRYVGDYIQYSTYAEVGGIDSVPNVMFNNVLAASGIIGIILFVIFFLRLYMFSKNDKSGFSSNLVVITIVFCMVYFNIVFLFLIGIIVGIYCKQQVQIRNLRYVHLNKKKIK